MATKPRGGWLKALVKFFFAASLTPYSLGVVQYWDWSVAVQLHLTSGNSGPVIVLRSIKQVDKIYAHDRVLKWRFSTAQSSCTIIARCKMLIKKKLLHATAIHIMDQYKLPKFWYDHRFISCRHLKSVHFQIGPDFITLQGLYVLLFHNLFQETRQSLDKKGWKFPR